jgi:hypothetical protein
MQRRKKRPSDESAESSLDREELRIYLTQSPWRLAGGVMSVNKKTAIKHNKTLISRQMDFY